MNTKKVTEFEKYAIAPAAGLAQGSITSYMTTRSDGAEVVAAGTVVSVRRTNRFEIEVTLKGDNGKTYVNKLPANREVRLYSDFFDSTNSNVPTEAVDDFSALLGAEALKQQFTAVLEQNMKDFASLPIEES